LIKTRATGGRASVAFTVDAAVAATKASVCGEWNDWSPDSDPMTRAADGSFSVTVELEAGRAYRFRYLIDGSVWENDWVADAYVPNGFGGDDSVVDLTALVGDAPTATGGDPPGSEPEAAPKAKATKAPTGTSARTGVRKAAAKKAASDSGSGGDAAPPRKTVRKSAKKSSD
jgi:hypothetical protein